MSPLGWSRSVRADFHAWFAADPASIDGRLARWAGYACDWVGGLIYAPSEQTIRALLLRLKREYLRNQALSARVEQAEALAAQRLRTLEAVGLGWTDREADPAAVDWRLNGRRPA